MTMLEGKAVETIVTRQGKMEPALIEGYGPARRYFAASDRESPNFSAPSAERVYEDKLCSCLAEVFDRVGIKDGMTLSFHHHLRNGDRVLNLVMEEVLRRGIKNIHLAASGIFPCHEPLVALMEKGVVTKITTSTFNPGPVPTAISEGKLRDPVVLQTHGGRPRAIESGELSIDVAFIAAPSCDRMGNLNGTHGRSACGFLSYAYADAMYANCVVAVTDNLVDYPACPIEIGQDMVDFVVCVDSIGDPKGIVSGTTRITTDPVRLKIACDTVRLMDQTHYIRAGMSFQTGAGSTALAVAAELEKVMLRRGVVGSFGLGGIHSYFVHMLEAGVFEKLLDVQCFDLDAVRSAAEDPRHMGISGALYANPCRKGCVVDMLDVVILGATEVDLDFNVNVITGSDGTIIGASGGNSDCAAGAKLTIVVSNLMKKKRCLVKERVTTITTPGDTVDAVVTEYGVAVNPRRKDLIQSLSGSDLPVVEIAQLREIGLRLGAVDERPSLSDRIVGVVEYRDGSVIDLVYQKI